MAGARPAAHPYAVTDSPLPPLSGARELSQAAGICIAGAPPAGDIGSHCSPRLPAAGAWARALGGGRQTKERGAEPGGGGWAILTVGEKYRVEVGGRGCLVCLPLDGYHPPSLDTQAASNSYPRWGSCVPVM